MFYGNKKFQRPKKMHFNTTYGKRGGTPSEGIS